MILNLWYVHDEEGFIYSLRVKAYVAEGSEEEKLQFLRDRAQFDYLIAESFPVPFDYHINLVEGREERKLAVGHVSMLKMLVSRIALFEEAIKAVESRFSAQSNISVPENPVVCITPLAQNSEGTIEPRFNGQERF